MKTKKKKKKLLVFCNAGIETKTIRALTDNSQDFTDEVRLDCNFVYL